MLSARHGMYDRKYTDTLLSFALNNGVLYWRWFWFSGSALNHASLMLLSRECESGSVLFRKIDHFLLRIPVYDAQTQPRQMSCNSIPGFKIPKTEIRSGGCCCLTILRPSITPELCPAGVYLRARNIVCLQHLTALGGAAHTLHMALTTSPNFKCTRYYTSPCTSELVSNPSFPSPLILQQCLKTPTSTACRSSPSHP